jgi:hypothetical protein
MELSLASWEEHLVSSLRMHIAESEKADMQANRIAFRISGETSTATVLVVSRMKE